MMRKPSALILLCFSTLLTLGASAQKPPAAKPEMKTTYLKAGRLFDGTGDSVRENMVIVIEGERIQRVAPAAEIKIPAGATVLDLSRATVLPGLIDCHTHLGGRADRYDPIYNFKDTPFQSAFAAVLNARRTLEVGFTTVRAWARNHFWLWTCAIRSRKASWWARAWWHRGRGFPSPAATAT